MERHYFQKLVGIWLMAWVMTACALAEPVPQHGAHGRPDVRPAESGLGAAFDAKGNLWVVYKENEPAGRTYLKLKMSPDKGKTWPYNRTLHEEPVAARGEERPKIAIGKNNEIYIAYTKPIARPHVGDIRFLRSVDGGKTFSSPVTVHANRDVITHAFTALIVDGKGHIYVSWIDGRDKERAKADGRTYVGNAIYYAVSEDGGLTFRGDYRVADHSCECCRLAMALMPGGSPAIMWRHVFEPNIRDHALAALSPSGRAAPLQRVSFDDWRIDACPHHGPSFAYAADGKRHQVWFDGKHGRALYQQVDGSGKPGEAHVLGGIASSHADVAAQNDTVVLAWRQFDGQIFSLWVRVSRDGGQSWKERLVGQTKGEADKPYLVTGLRDIVLVWNTGREGVKIFDMEISK